jgi:hypothetical protein
VCRKLCALSKLFDFTEFIVPKDHSAMRLGR